MEFIQLIRGRESIRNYDPGRPVDRSILERILEAGRIAPSAKNFQPWRFILVSSPELLAKVKSSYSRPWIMDAPHMLIVTGRTDVAWTRSDGYNSLETDLTIALTYMILAAENEGIGTCWIGAFDLKALRESLNLNENERVYNMTPLGYQKPGFQKRANVQRKTLQDIAEFV